MHPSAVLGAGTALREEQAQAQEQLSPPAAPVLPPALAIHAFGRTMSTSITVAIHPHLLLPADGRQGRHSDG
ncbi:hypothetical protein U9M48_022128 [Paspalum notatum var. saurae]|uniref:Uncharacterized protein n=1 Tax=Paspalum notatum var. saurae TaxID=547442 RepID=A0AAQ3WUG8_PASNO